MKNRSRPYLFNERGRYFMFLRIFERLSLNEHVSSDHEKSIYLIAGQK